ncbi:MAG: outer membrane protein assembly factor BamD [Thermoanaerobaculia bacterium]|nr:outer membrane protein assembly factor BamD [Thermoanaerobaculia bacterium]
MTVRFKTGIAISLLCAFALVVAGCRSKNEVYQPKVNPEFLSLSKEEIFAKGEELYSRDKWAKCREYFSYVYENFPNDPLARRSLLRIADAYQKQGREVDLVEAQYKYRDFINRFPGSELADYATLQIANVAFLQMEKPDRDQTRTKEAIQKYKEMLTLYPASPYRGEAEANLRKAYDNLGQHEQSVARFYMKRSDFNAALPRLEGVLRDFPEYSRRDALYYDLGVTLAGLGRAPEARLYLERVINEFPEGEAAAESKKMLERLPA